MAWNQDLCLKFIKLYRGESVLWDPNHDQRKYRPELHDAWDRISEALDIPVTELRAKKESLLATYRGHRRRKRASLSSATCKEDVYEPVWFAYKALEDFLDPENRDLSLAPNSVLPGHSQKQEVDQGTNEAGETEGAECRNEVSSHDEEIQPNTITRSNALTSHERRLQRRRQRRIHNGELRRITQPFRTPSNDMVSKNYERKEDDDCALYGKLLAKKLRNYPLYERHRLMHGIDGLLLRNPPPGIGKTTPTVQFSSRLPIESEAVDAY